MGYKPIQVALTLFISVLIFQLMGITTLILTAIITKGAIFPIDNLIQIILILFIINIFQFALSFFLASLFNKSAAYQSVAMIVFFYQMFLGGMTFPPEMLPQRIRMLSEIFNPIIHGLYVMREIWVMGRSVLEFPLEVGILLGTSAVFILLGSKMFKWYDLQS